MSPFLADLSPIKIFTSLILLNKYQLKNYHIKEDFIIFEHVKMTKRRIKEYIFQGVEFYTQFKVKTHSSVYIKYYFL